jgi:predicted phage terminase large subunit-like protein
LKRKLGSYSFSALYQQRPTPADGGLFKRSWFTRVIDAAPPGLRWKRGYDLAVSTKTTACYTASARCAFDKEGNLYIADVFRKRMEYPEQRRYILNNLLTETDTEHGIELAVHGQGIIQDLRREARARYHAFRGIKVDGDKLTRALPWANLAEEGKTFLVRGPWNDEFLDEVCRFPKGRFDDQIDAVSIAVKMCAERKLFAYGF